MKNTIIIGVLLVVAAGSWWALSSKSADDVVNTEAVSPLEQAATADDVVAVESGKGSLLGLLALGKSQECSFVVRVDGMTQEGTAFYDGGNARVDTLVTGAGTPEPMASYMIMDKVAGTMYMWGTAQGNQGIKLALTESVDTPDAPSTDASPQSVTPDMAVDYTCKPWRVDGSVFVPPADVEFMDMTDMQKMMEGMGGVEMPGQ